MGEWHKELAKDTIREMNSDELRLIELIKRTDKEDKNG